MPLIRDVCSTTKPNKRRDELNVVVRCQRVLEVSVDGADFHALNLRESIRQHLIIRREFEAICAGIVVEVGEDVVLAQQLLPSCRLEHGDVGSGTHEELDDALLTNVFGNELCETGNSDVFVSKRVHPQRNIWHGSEAVKELGLVLLPEGVAVIENGRDSLFSDSCRDVPKVFHVQDCEHRLVGTLERVGDDVPILGKLAAVRAPVGVKFDELVLVRCCDPSVVIVRAQLCDALLFSGIQRLPHLLHLLLLRLLLLPCRVEVPQFGVLDVRFGDFLLRRVVDLGQLLFGEAECTPIKVGSGWILGDVGRHFTRSRRCARRRA
mmetsp:Transcript_46036/g.99723  ORF Transcript_46036/g.99723 Transcript_46036/m.99723 type:complete len:322 (+) Transcript_46036:867-1832(+)